MFFVTFPHYAFVTPILQRKPVFQQILYIYSFVLSCNTYQVISKIHQYCRQGTEFKSYSINSFPPVVIRSMWHMLASFVFVCICCLNKVSPMDFFLVSKFFMLYFSLLVWNNIMSKKMYLSSLKKKALLLKDATHLPSLQGVIIVLLVEGLAWMWVAADWAG